LISDIRIAVMDLTPINAGLAQENMNPWGMRQGEWEEDNGAGQLGQHNPDAASTRTKITHIEGLGYGIIGSVLSLAYGSWLGQPAALLIMEFGFSAKRKLFRYKDIEISISFDAGTLSTVKSPNAKPPVVCSWYPKNNRTSKRRAKSLGDNLNHTLSASDSTSTSILSTAQWMWPVEEFWIRGRKWSARHRQEPHEVIWNVTDTENSISGISEQIRLAVIVTYSEPFRAVVGVKATIGFGLPVRNFPWSQDDPLLFDGKTPKGAPPPNSDFSALTEQDLLGYISDPNLAMETNHTHMITTNHQSLSLDQSTAIGYSGSRPRRVCRVRGIPTFWSGPTLIHVLSSSMTTSENAIRLHSFAENPYRAEKMAIVSFEESHDEVLNPNHKKEWLIQAQLPNEGAYTKLGDGKVIQLLLDTHFYGFSELGLRLVNPSPYNAE
jgi:hypothetical protein